MTDRPKRDRAARRGRPGEQERGRRPRSSLRLRRRSRDGQWELVHPACARERIEDLEEVREMLEAGEVDVAVDELRWLIAECNDFVEAHRLLGELALAEGDKNLARAHFGFAYDLGLGAIPAEGPPGPIAYAVPANQAFLEAAKGLAWCLHDQGHAEQALDVVAMLLRCDPTDPLGVAPWREQWSRGGST